MKTIKKVLIWWVLLPLLPVWGTVEIKQVKAFPLSQSDVIIEKANSFIVTGDDQIMVADGKAANIKIFDMTGKRLKIFGRKGMGPNEFVRPRRITLKEPFIAIVDFGRKNIFVYKRFENNRFEFVQKFLCLDLGYDFHLIDEKSLMITGDKLDEKRKWYNLYQYNFKEKIYDFILPAETAYGYSSYKKYQQEKNEKIKYIGRHLFFDVSSDYIYLVWKGNNKVICINRKTKEIKRFGEKTKRFITPYVTPEIKKAYHQRDHRLIWKIQRSMSAVKDIIVTKKDNVGVIYTGPFEKNGSLPVMIQLYTGSGEFLKEFEVMNAKASHHTEIYFYFRKSDNRFFILDTETTDDFDQSYRVREFQVKE